MSKAGQIIIGLILATTINIIRTTTYTADDGESWRWEEETGLTWFQKNKVIR
jgi:hypothetical protein